MTSHEAVVVAEPVTVPGVVILPPVQPAGALLVSAPVTVSYADNVGMWTGEGPPETVIGARVGDEYLDTLTGTIYRLDEG